MWEHWSDQSTTLDTCDYFVVGLFMSVFGLFMTSICQEYWQILLAQGVVTGAGFGCLFLPGVTVVSQYFSTKKAFATGIASLGRSIGI